jgi:hypothetical protein
MKIYLVKEHMALQDGQRETVTAAYLDRKNAEDDAHGHLEGHYTHWMVDVLDIRDARSFFKKQVEKKPEPKAEPPRRKRRER